MGFILVSVNNRRFLLPHQSLLELLILDASRFDLYTRELFDKVCHAMPCVEHLARLLPLAQASFRYHCLT